MIFPPSVENWYPSFDRRASRRSYGGCGADRLRAWIIGDVLDGVSLILAGVMDTFRRNISNFRRTGILSRQSHFFLPNFSQSLHGPSEVGKVVPFIAGFITSVPRPCKYA